MAQIMIKVDRSKDTSEVVFLDTKEEETIIKGLRLILLVGADHETMIAAKLLDQLLPPSQK